MCTFFKIVLAFLRYLLNVLNIKNSFDKKEKIHLQNI